MPQTRNERTQIQWLVREFTEDNGGDNMEFFDRLRDARAYAEKNAVYGYSIDKVEVRTWEELYRYDDGQTEWQDQFDYEILKENV